MYTKQDFLDSVAHEIAVCKHIATKLQEDKLDYRPCEGVRSTRELLQYLPLSGSAVTLALTTGDWQIFPRLREELGEVTLANFAEKMDAQLAAITGALAEHDDGQLATKEVQMPWGPGRLGRALVDYPLKFLCGYRLQLFNHAKAAGASELGTSNAWWGTDPQES